ncbi:hypothetical protein LZ554_007035 [Drepanopeziza brunnea f. sp. 'monogermtubi']|nr:hypothetical protein LZ554_007035 [Drepanopeziza brunnea f. sp. 'monogermtubi']
MHAALPLRLASNDSFMPNREKGRKRASDKSFHASEAAVYAYDRSAEGELCSPPRSTSFRVAWSTVRLIGLWHQEPVPT